MHFDCVDSQNLVAAAGALGDCTLVVVLISLGLGDHRGLVVQRRPSVTGAGDRSGLMSMCRLRGRHTMVVVFGVV